jgi:hypothetical protein
MLKLFRVWKKYNFSAILNRVSILADINVQMYQQGFVIFLLIFSMCVKENRTEELE